MEKKVCFFFERATAQSTPGWGCSQTPTVLDYSSKTWSRGVYNSVKKGGGHRLHKYQFLVIFYWKFLNKYGLKGSMFVPIHVSYPGYWSVSWRISTPGYGTYPLPVNTPLVLYSSPEVLIGVSESITIFW